MSHVMLTSTGDLEWVREVHLSRCTLPDFAVAEIIGNEDSPDAIVLYERDHINSLTMRLTPNVDGDFVYHRPRW